MEPVQLNSCSDEEMKEDKFIAIKEQWLLEKYLLNLQIEKQNQKQKIV
jgi:hypothetical protein